MTSTRWIFGFCLAMSVTGGVGCEEKSTPSSASGAPASPPPPASTAPPTPTPAEPAVVDGPSPIGVKVTDKIDSAKQQPFIEYTNSGTRKIASIDVDVLFLDASHQKLGGESTSYTFDLEPGAKMERVSCPTELFGKKVPGLIVDAFVYRVTFADGSQWKTDVPPESKRTAAH